MIFEEKGLIFLAVQFNWYFDLLIHDHRRYFTLSNKYLRFGVVLQVNSTLHSLGIYYCYLEIPSVFKVSKLSFKVNYYLFRQASNPVLQKFKVTGIN